MMKFLSPLAAVALALTPAVAYAGDAAATGDMVYTADGKRLGAIYRLKADGTAQIIVNGKMVSVPGDTLTKTDGKVSTSLTKADLKKKK